MVSSLNRDGTPVTDDLRWGVYVVLEAPNAYTAECFSHYGLITDASGRYAAMYKPFHLIGLELNVSILSAVLRHEPTGATAAFNADVVATAKRDLKRGERLDGEGGYTAWGKLTTAEKSVTSAALPIGLADRAKLVRDIKANQVLHWDDVQFDTEDDIVISRKALRASPSQQS